MLAWIYLKFKLGIEQNFYNIMFCFRYVMNLNRLSGLGDLQHVPGIYVTTKLYIVMYNYFTYYFKF